MASSSGSPKKPRKLDWTTVEDGFGLIVPTLPPAELNKCVSQTIKLVIEVGYRVKWLRSGVYSLSKRELRVDRNHMLFLVLQSPVSLYNAIARLKDKSLKAENGEEPWPYRIRIFKLYGWDSTVWSDRDKVDEVLRELDDGPILGFLSRDPMYDETPPGEIWKLDQTKKDKIKHCVAIVGYEYKENAEDLPMEEQFFFKGIESSGGDFNRLISIHCSSLEGFYSLVIPAADPPDKDLYTAVKESTRHAFMKGVVLHDYEECQQRLVSENDYLKTCKFDGFVAQIDMCVLAEGYDPQATSRIESLCQSLDVLTIKDVCTADELAEWIGLGWSCYCVLVTNWGGENEGYAFLRSKYGIP